MKLQEIISTPPAPDLAGHPLPERLCRLLSRGPYEDQPCVALLDLDVLEEGDALELAKAWLSREEEAIWRGFKLAKRQREWLGGRLCAKAAAKAFCRQQGRSCAMPQDLKVTNLDHGRPQFTGPAGWQAPELSITHSGQYAAALVADSRCGIDLQQLSKTLDKTLERYSTTEEIGLLRQAAPTLSARQLLALLWSAKEALKKALGHEQLPGFLELVLTRAVSHPEHDLLLCFDHLAGPTPPPVAAGLLSPDYALALCRQGI